MLRPIVTQRTLLSSLLVASSVLAAEDATSQRARAELESQLQSMVRIPPPQVEIVFSGIDATDYELVSAAFTLDNQALPAPEQPAAGRVIFSGNLAAGPHLFGAQITYKEAPNKIFTYMNGSKFKVPSKVEFVAQRGLRVHIRAGIHVQEGADASVRLRPANKVEPEMLAQLDDGSMPEAMKRPGPKAPEPPPAEPPPLVAAAPDTAPVKKQVKHPHDKHGPALAALEPEPLTPPAPTPTPPPAPTPAPAPVPPPKVVEATPAPESGLSTTAKLGIVGGVMLVSLLGLTLALRKRG